MTHRSIVASAIVAAIALPHAAHAQSAEAETLFRDGRALIKAGRLQQGCDKLEASNKLEPSVGTLLNLGDCREQLGKLASAWAAFRKAESLAKHTGRDDKRMTEAGKRAAALEGRLSNLVIEVRQPVDGLVIKRAPRARAESELVDRAAWGVAVPVDPDTYTIVAEAPGFAAWRLDVEIDGKVRRKVVSVPRLEPAPAPALPPPALVVEPAPNPAVAIQPERHGALYRHRTWNTARGIAAGMAVLGLGSVGGGAYLAIRSRDLEHRADQRCPLAACADPQALRDNADAKTFARNANIAFAAGGALVVVAGAVWLIGKPGDELVIAPASDGHSAGVTLTTRFR